MKTVKLTFLFICFLLTEFISAQNITNTLGSSGTFTIKNGSTNYFTLSQADGTVSLISSIAGNQRSSIFKGTDRFLHTYYGSGTIGLNTFLGLNAGNFSMGGTVQQGSYNTGVGYGSLMSLTSGSYNSAFGLYSLKSNTTGYDNSAFGYSALYNTTGNYNSAFGYSALYNTTGNYNSAFGSEVLYSNTSGYNNSAFGNQALYSNTNGYQNSAFGHLVLYFNTFGYRNSAFGHSALVSNTTGYENSAFGSSALNDNTDGVYNSAFGYSALYNNTTGGINSAFGYSALKFNTTGYANSAFGYSALYSNTTGGINSAFGYSALYSNSTGYYNSAFGYNAGKNLTGGSNNTFIGNNAQPSAVSVSNEITLGDANITTLRCKVTTITALSDRRDKKNIKYLPLGLDFLMKIKPRLFNWDRREWYEDGISDGSKMDKTPTAGFIAQELDSVQINTGAEWLNLVLKTNPERLEATPGNLFPIVVKAIQDLKFENDALAEENAKLQNELEILRASITGIVKAEVKAAFLRAVENKGSAVEVSLLGSRD